METTIGATRLVLERADITTVETDAIVNAANSELAGGGGVDGAIHRAAGPSLIAECREIRQADGPCPPGEVVITGAGDLSAKWVIHAVGPVWRDGIYGEYVLLERVHIRALERAVEAGARRITFPAISTGAYGFPTDRAALIALNTAGRYLQENPEALDEVRFVLFDDDALRIWEQAADQVVRTMLG